jgi:hypothetical protein
MFTVPIPGKRKRTFFDVVGQFFDQRNVPFLIPDLERDLEFGVHITIAHARNHTRPEVRQWYRDVCEWFVEFEALMQSWRAAQSDLTRQALVRHAGIKEPREVRLGYSKDGHSGHGIGGGALHDRLIAFFAAHPDVLHDCTIEPDTMSMAEHFSTDRVSDTMVAVGKRRVIEFTQWCADYFGFDPKCMRVVPIYNIWQPAHGRFGTEEHRVPVDDDGNPILLVPSHIVRSGPPFSTGAYFRNVYGPDYTGPTGKRALLDDARQHPGRLSTFASDWLKDPKRYQIRRDLLPPKPPRRRSK